MSAAPASPLATASKLLSSESAVAILWAAGFLLSLGLLAWREIHFRRRLRGARRVTAPQQLGEIEAQARAMGVLRPIEVYALDLASGPASAGLLRARLLLPSDFFHGGTISSRRCVLLHELAHLRRFDGAGNLVVAIAQALQWFNPFVHLAARRFRAVREQVRDHEALSVANPPSPSHYAATLLDALERHSGDPARGTLPAIGLLEGQEWKRRFLMIRSFGQSSRSSSILSVLLVGSLASVVLVGASAKPLLPITRPGDAPSGVRVERFAKPMPWLVDLERGLSKRIDEFEAHDSAAQVASALAAIGGFRVSLSDDVRPSFEETKVGLSLRAVTAREALEVLAQLVGDVECVETPNGVVLAYTGWQPALTESRFYSLDTLLRDVEDDARADVKNAIVDLVRQFCADEGQWDRSGYGISVFRDLLVVKADARTHEQTLAFLEQLSARTERRDARIEATWERDLEQRLEKRIKLNGGIFTMAGLVDRVRQVAKVTLIIPQGSESSEIEIGDENYTVREISSKMAASFGMYLTPWNGAIRFASAPRTEIGMYEIGNLVGANDSADDNTHRDELFDMVRSQVQPESWDACPAFATCGHRGLMIVRQTSEAHDEIRAMLSALGRAMAGG